MTTPTQAQIEAAAEKIYEDFAARMGGAWKYLADASVIKVQCMATAKAALTAAFAVDTRTPRSVRQHCGSVVRRAIKRGMLKRPAQCQRCGAQPRRNKAGVSQIQAHHKDYSKPLEVEWLCVDCHRTATPWPSVPSGKANGLKNSQSKLDEMAVRAIRSLKGKTTSADLAKTYNVNPTTIQRIWKGELWDHVR